MKKIFLSDPGSRVRQVTCRFSRNCFSIVELNCRFIVSWQYFLMYFTIKYNVFYKYIINATTAAINACKKGIWRWSKGGNFFIYVSYLTRKSTLYFLSVSKYWHDRKRWEKEANIVTGARFCYCRIYHKFVNFIILNLFKVVKWKSCFILLHDILVLWYCSQINAPNYTKSK